MAKRYKTTTHDSSIMDAVEDAKSVVEELASEMSEWRDNMEEKLSQTEKYERVSEAADCLEGSGYDYLDVPQAITDHGELSNLTFKVSQIAPYGRKAHPRWMRLANAVACLEGAHNELSRFLDAAPEEDATEELRREVEDFVGEIQDVIDELNSVEFPGMYG